MTSIFASLAVLAFLMVQSQRSFVDTAPAPTSLSSDEVGPSMRQSYIMHGSPEVAAQYAQDDVVRDLENLKNSVGKSIEMVKTHSEIFSNVNGIKEAHSNMKAQLNKDGKLVASVGQRLDEVPGLDGSPTSKIQTKIDIPSEGVHKNVVQQLDPRQTNPITENGNRRSNIEVLPEPSNYDKNGAYSGIQYSPLDMAEYVFWTGDEKGVTLAIEEFLQEGLMSREEAISFLQEIKYNLDYLQKHYSEVGLNTRERSKEKESTPNGLFYNMKDTNNKGQTMTQYDINEIKAEARKKNNAAWTNFIKEQTKLDHNSSMLKESEQYDELLERLRVADFLYTEYSLEEVIYQLAKVMFTQSLTRGSMEAQQSLQKFTNFLENEAEQGRISRALEKKVLDVLIASLTDTVNEHPELTSNNPEPRLPITTPKESLMKQLLKLNSVNNKAISDILSSNYNDELRENKLIPLRNEVNGNGKGLTLDLEKYKHP